MFEACRRKYGLAKRHLATAQEQSAEIPGDKKFATLHDALKTLGAILSYSRFLVNLFLIALCGAKGIEFVKNAPRSLKSFL
jgi:hypothetical protein